jgi:branched-chain amino acid transport system ATP-binding protein
MPDPLLEVRGIDGFYGDFQALFGVSLRVEAGQVIAVIGANGAGKSTLLKSIVGMMHPHHGEILLDGAPITRAPAFEAVKRGIALVPEGRRLFTRMTVEENLEVGCYRPEARRTRTATLERVYGLFPVLRHRRHQLAGSLSGGQQQMVAIGRALMACPRLLLLDEPSLGLAPAVVDTMFDVIRTIHDEGVAILLVEQNVVRALDVADRAYVLEGGRIVAEGTPATLRGQAAIQQAYLGLREQG